MAEGDDDMEADVLKPPVKRSLDHVPLKIIIKRHRPNAESQERPTFKAKHRPNVEAKERPNLEARERSNVKIKQRSNDKAKERPIVKAKERPIVTPRCSVSQKPNARSVLPLLLLSKYADIPELVTAFETEKPKGLQEIWHSVRQQQQEEEFEKDRNGKPSMQRYYAAGTCDFGPDCEMPWLHPVINVTSWENCSEEDKIKKGKQSAPEKCLCDEKRCETNDYCETVDENSEHIHFSDWRYGAAKLWYDSMDIPDDCKNFTYGFKLQQEPSDCEKKNIFSDDAFLMVTQLPWEDDVIWNGQDIKEKKPEVLKKMISKWVSVGGKDKPSYDRMLPTSRYSLQHRLPGYLQVRGRDFFSNQQLILKSPFSMQNQYSMESKDKNDKDFLPFDNEDLTIGTWENEIIWDAESMSQIPKPKIPILDPNDENIVIGVPDDVNFTQPEWSSQNPDCIKLCHPYKKGTKILIGKTGITNLDEEEQHPFSFEDPFNVSNDSYYALKSSETSLRLKPVGKLIQHSIPVLELRPPFIPTHLNVFRLQNFHRMPLKRYSYGILSQPVAHPVYSLSREISLKSQIREEERQMSGGGEVFFMREPEDLTGRDGELVLVEFSEEHPLLMNEVGMCSKIINYYKRKASKDQGPPQLKYGEVVYPHTSPFLGVLSQGQCVQAVENNLYRSPIFEHPIQETDFLIIRSRHSYAIREVDALFTAGQQCPLFEVPAPHSRPATNFTKDFLQVHIFRMFHDCPDKPQWVRMDEIKRAFPDINDLNIRKSLKLCADFKRVDAVDSFCWVLRPDFRLPTEEEMRSMVTPEQCCAQFSMLAAEQRLKDAGYGGNVLFVPPDEDDEENEEGMQLKIDDEIKAAPWNLTRGFIQSLNGKHLLDLTGLADPTGCGEGFSYLTKSIRRGKQFLLQDTEVEKEKEKEKEKQEKPTVASAKILLKKMGVPDKDIKKLSCWELVDIAKTISKKKMKGRGRSTVKIPKAKPMTTAEHIAKYKEECQRIFDLQNRVLQSSEELSTDEEEVSDDDGSDVEEMGKILEKLISDGRSYSELTNENEEKEREELVKMMMDDNALKQNNSKDKAKKNDHKDPHNGPQPSRVLKINRTFRDSNGKEYTRVEFVRKSSVIDIYLKIRATKDEAFISQFALESAEKQKIMREKRNIEGQLQRLKQRQHILGSKNNSNVTSAATSSNVIQNGEDHSGQKESSSKSFISPPSRKGFNSKLDQKRRCGACGNPGHKRGNKACPQYCAPVNVAMTEEEEEEYHRQMNVDDQNLVNVDGTKLKLSVKLIKRAEEMKRKTLVLRVPKDIVRKRKRPVVETHCDYLEKYQKTVNRRRVDPLVVLSNAFEAILSEMRDLPDSDPFHFPVNAKSLPQYYTFISRPMDLQTIRENLRQRKYRSRKDFLEDVHQIVQNSATFNGPESPFTIKAGKMLDLCAKRMEEQEEELMRLEETINPLDDEKDQSMAPLKTATHSVINPHIEETVPKSIVDLDISDTEDEAENERGYLDGRACPVVP